MTVRSVNPRTGQLIRATASSTPSEVRNAITRARRCQKERYKDTTREDRASLVKELEAVCLRHKDEVVGLMHEEVGIPRKALAGAYSSALSGTDRYIEEYLSAGDRQYPLPSSWTATDANISFPPHGVIGHIGVWNFPFWQTMITAIPALLTGNAVVFKPSELSTLSGLRITELVHEAGYPRDMFVPVVGGADVGKQMVASDCDALVFTGGIETGLDIVRNAGIRPMILELSGNDAGIVRADADLEQAARGIAYGTFGRGGQVCVRIKRVYAHVDVVDELLDRLVGIAERLSLEEDVGPLIREEAREKVERAVRDAVEKGAELLCGGRKPDGPGFYYLPTVLRHSDDDLEVVRKETFGPVCPVRAVRDDDEAVRLANDTRYGLGATVWTSDPERGAEIAQELEAGNVWINECVRTLPGGEYFQGWKQSGIPSSMSRLQMFTKKKTVVAHRSCEPRAHWFA
ncbi:MAG: aldehyde dehydrogenase [Methanomassiliicoccus sp.]|nr:aldehyde dehydrogenase [Methanomassiliicoccus sp.]